MSKPKKATATTGRPKGSHSKFEGYEVRDAEAPMMIPLLQVDIDNAEQYKEVDINDHKRFKQCVVAQACGRMLGQGGHVRINRSIAYVAYDDADYALRFQLSPNTRKVVETFDRGKRSRSKIKPGQMLQFNPPDKSHSLTALRSRAQDRRPSSGPSKGVRRQNVIDIELRHGAFAR